MTNDILKGRIYNIVLTHKYWKKSTVGLKYPYVLVSTSSMTNESDQSLINSGWKHTGYDYYAGLHRYEKVMDIRKNLEVKVTFSPYLKERFFPVPQEIIEDIAQADYKAEKKDWNISISEKMKAQIISLLRPSLEQYVRN